MLLNLLVVPDYSKYSFPVGWTIIRLHNHILLYDGHCSKYRVADSSCRKTCHGHGLAPMLRLLRSLFRELLSEPLEAQTAKCDSLFRITILDILQSPRKALLSCLSKELLQCIASFQISGLVANAPDKLENQHGYKSVIECS